VAWLLAAAAVFVVSAAAASSAGQRVWREFIRAREDVSGSHDALASGRAVTKHLPHELTPPAPSALAATRSETASLDVLVAAAAPPPPAPSSPAPEAASPSALHRSSSRGGVSAAAHVTNGGGAAALFEAAAEARRQESYVRAIELQRELLSRYPRSRESHVTRETMGRLLLDRGDPAGAYASFNAYLTEGSGELGEEAMVGRATALERLGRSGQAADAWRALLAAYPETPYAAQARSRLGSLSDR
jgi:TolA-binding protein